MFTMKLGAKGSASQRRLHFNVNSEQVSTSSPCVRRREACVFTRPHLSTWCSHAHITVRVTASCGHEASCAYKKQQTGPTFLGALLNQNWDSLLLRGNLTIKWVLATWCNGKKRQNFGVSTPVNLSHLWVKVMVL